MGSTLILREVYLKGQQESKILLVISKQWKIDKEEQEAESLISVKEIVGTCLHKNEQNIVCMCVWMCK